MSGEPSLLLAIDTSTSTAVVALGDLSGRHLAEDRWVAGFRHGEELLPRIDALLAGHGARIADVAAVVVGTGPGAFTGLRVGIATAKGLAVALGRPLVGIPSGAALIEAARDLGAVGPIALLLPAGPSERTLVRAASGDGDAGGTGGERGSGADPHPVASRLPADAAPDPAPDATLVAVDLERRAPADALELGRRSVGLLGRVLVRLGASRLASVGRDDPAGVVPEYVTLPRGVDREEGAIVMGTP